MDISKLALRLVPIICTVIAISIILISSGSVGLDDDTVIDGESGSVSVYYPPDKIESTESDTNESAASSETDTSSYTETAPTTESDLLELYISGDYIPSETALTSLYDAISAFGNELGFIAEDVNTGMTISYNADTKIKPASIIKAAYALYVCRQLDSGNGTLYDRITYTEDDYCTGNGKIASSGFGTVYSLREVLYHMINTSDNEGYYMLLRRYGRSGFNSMMRSLGCESGIMTGSAGRWPTVTARDFSRVWAEIYEYRNESYYGQLLYKYLCGVSFQRFFRDALGVETANKAGWNSESYNDTGIIYGERTYIFVLLTSASYYTADKAAFADIVCAVNSMMTEYADISPEPPETSRYDVIFDEPKPPVTDTEPPVTDTEPPVTDTEPPVTDTEPPVTDTEPPVTDTEPPVTDTEPPVTDTEPPVTDTEPPVTDTEPPVTDTEPPVTDTEPPVTDTEPPVTDTEPPAPDTEPIDT